MEGVRERQRDNRIQPDTPRERTERQTPSGMPQIHPDTPEMIDPENFFFFDYPTQIGVLGVFPI